MTCLVKEAVVSRTGVVLTGFCVMRSNKDVY